MLLFRRVSVGLKRDHRMTSNVATDLASGRPQRVIVVGAGQYFFIERGYKSRDTMCSSWSMTGVSFSWEV